jgi:hypothetical protein
LTAIRHREESVPGYFCQKTGVAVCGALKSDGAEFTPWFRRISCRACRRITILRRLMAKRRQFAEAR